MELSETLYARCKAFKRNRFPQEEYNKLLSVASSPDAFYEYLGKNFMEWSTPYSKAVETGKGVPPKFFTGGSFYPSQNILFKHLDTPRKNKAALIWKGADQSEKIFTYQSLYSEVIKFASAMHKLGLKKGDRVLLYMPNVPELVVGMIACTIIGAIHVVYHHSFSAESLADRIDNCTPTVIITSDATVTGTDKDLKGKVDKALYKSAHQPKYVIVAERTGARIHMKPLRDIWYHDLIGDEEHSRSSRVDWAPINATDPMFMIYTASKLKEPRALVYPAAGFLAWAHYSYSLLFDVGDIDTYWCTADISWITGHAYIIYGPLMSGQTVLIYEDTIDYHNARRFYDICEKFRVNKVYTTPTILRALMSAAQKANIFREIKWLNLVATGGEKMPEDVLEWTSTKLAASRCCVTDIYTLTEAGGAIISGIPGYVFSKPGTVSKPLPGVPAVLADPHTGTIFNDVNKQGVIVMNAPFPALCSDIYGETDLYRSLFWREKKGGEPFFRTNDGAQKDADGYFTLTGRMDDVLSMGGKRMSLVELEEAIKKYEHVKDAAVINIHDEKRGDRLIAFCVLAKNVDESWHDQLVREIRQTIINEIGEVVLPSEVRFTKILPKAPDGAILRDLLKEIAMQM